MPLNRGGESAHKRLRFWLGGLSANAEIALMRTPPTTGRGFNSRGTVAGAASCTANLTRLPSLPTLWQA
jgi:hypothetical protein